MKKYIFIINLFIVISAFPTSLKNKDIIYYYFNENIFKNDETIFLKNILNNYQIENNNILFYNPYKDNGLEDYTPINEYFLKIIYANDCSIFFQEEEKQIILNINLNRTKCNFYENKEYIISQIKELIHKKNQSENFKESSYKDYVLEYNNIFKNTIFIYCSDKIKRFSRETNSDKKNFHAKELKKYNAATRFLSCSDQVFTF